MHNGDVPVYAHGDQGVGAEEDHDDLHVEDDGTHPRLERPVVLEVHHEREGNAKDREEDVADCQVDDEVVGHRVHPLVGEHQVTHDAVAADGGHGDDAVENDEEGLHVL